MESVLSSPIRVWFQLNPSYSLHNKHITTTYTFRRSIIHHKLPLPCSIRAQQSEGKDGSEIVSTTSESGGDALNIKEWEVGRLEDEVAAQGIRIRRRPPTGPSQHYVGQFEFRLQNEGNTPRSILEEIIWNKDVEVSQMKENRPLGVVARALENAPPARDFIGALKASHSRTGLPSLIAEVKKASPSRGVLREDFDPISGEKTKELLLRKTYRDIYYMSDKICCIV